MKRLGAFALLALVVTAAFATVASASGLEAYDPGSGDREGAATLKASPRLELIFGGEGLECNSSTEASLQGRSSSAVTTVTPGCGGLKMNNCILTYHTGAEQTESSFAGTVDIGGAGCTALSITTLAGCQISVPAQSGIAVTFVNEGTGVRFETSGGISYTRSNCGAGNYTNGTLATSNDLVNAYDQAGTKVGLRVTNQVGIYTEGGSFHGESYPLGILGAETAAHTFESVPGSYIPFACQSVEFTRGTLWSTQSWLATASGYGQCTASGSFKAAIEMGGCGYTLNASGTMDIWCEYPGESISVKAFNSDGSTRCSISIPPQEGLSGVTLTNQGSGHDRTIEVDFELTGVDNTVLSGGLLGCGAKLGFHTDGTYSGSSLLEGQIDLS